MSRAPTAPCGVCQCQFGDTDCFHVFRYGEGPWMVEPTLDDDDSNLLECAPSGLAAFLPPHIADPPCCLVYRTLDQPIPDEAAQILSFNAEHYDTDSMHSQISTESSGSNNAPSRITFKTPGIYLVTLNIVWNKNGDGDRQAQIRKNGTDLLAIDSLPAGDADLYVGQSVSIEDRFSAGEYVEAMVKQDSGGNLSIESRRSSPTFAAMFMAQA